MRSLPARPHGTPVEIDLFRALLLDRSGIDVGAQRGTFLLERIRRRMTRAGARSLYEYYRMVAAPHAQRELQGLVNDVQIHETSFFRNPAQFALLGAVALPDRVGERLKGGKRRLVLWSAGCSTGQEIFSIAMTLQESVVLSPTWDVRLVGTDVSTQALELAGAGVYGRAQMEGVSEERRRRFFRRRGDEYAVRDWARRGLELQRGNLLDEPTVRDADVIFCRNVMIYFDRAGQKRLLQRLRDALSPGGYLFLGHTESLYGASESFQMIAHGRGIAYQRTS